MPVTVQVDGLVILKIIKHAQDVLPATACGALLGLDEQDADERTCVEATHCFPNPNTEESEADDSVVAFGTEMMRCLRDVNVDHSMVGWYTTSYLEGYVDSKTIQTQYDYQSSGQIRNSVMLVYDPMRTATGTLSLRAMRLTDVFMELYRNMKFTREDLERKRFTNDSIFEELPIVVHNPAIVEAMLYSWTIDGAFKSNCNFDRLELSYNPLLEKTLEWLTSSVDKLCTESNSFENARRQVQRQRAQYSEQKLGKWRKQDLGGMDLEEELRANFPEPSRFPILVAAHQVDSYCSCIAQFSDQAFEKLFLMGGLHRGDV